VVSVTDRYGRILDFLDRSRHFRSRTQTTEFSLVIDEIFAIITVGFEVTDQLLIIHVFRAFVRYWRKNGITMRHNISEDFK
jgi:hypothetical protein